MLSNYEQNRWQMQWVARLSPTRRKMAVAMTRQPTDRENTPIDCVDILACPANELIPPTTRLASHVNDHTLVLQHHCISCPECLQCGKTSCFLVESRLRCKSCLLRVTKLGSWAMEGPSSRLAASEEGPRRLAARRDSGGDGDCEPARDVKTHFRVCRFIMETGSSDPAVCGTVYRESDPETVSVFGVNKFVQRTLSCEVN